MANDLAKAIHALINSRPQSPTVEELTALIEQHSPDPSGIDFSGVREGLRHITVPPTWFASVPPPPLAGGGLTWCD